MTKVLIVDDEQGYRESIKIILDREGYNVETAKSPKMAIETAQSFQPDVLVVDWMLKDRLSGLDVAKSMRRTNRNVKTILITGYPSPKLKAEAEMENVAALLVKPVDANELRGAVDRASGKVQQIENRQKAVMPVLERGEDLLRLPDHELQSILLKLDLPQTKYSGTEKRDQPRRIFRTFERLEIQLVQSDHVRRKFRVVARNISHGGIALLHGSFVYTDTVCITQLRTIDGEYVLASGRVVHCRHICHRVHEVGVKFDDLIDIADFLPDDE